MSLQALSWVLDFSETGANDRLVMMILGHHADNGGYVSASRGTIAMETRLGDRTVKRILDRLCATDELVEVDAGEAPPDWWKALRRDHRPKLYRLAGFAATRGPDGSAARGRTGGHQAAPPSKGTGGHDDSPTNPDKQPSRGVNGGSTGGHADAVTSPNANGTENVERDTDNESGDEKPVTAQQRRKAEAKDIVDAFCIWVRDHCETRRPESYVGMRNVVTRALEMGLTRPQVKNALVSIQNSPPLSICVQNVWDAVERAKGNPNHRARSREPERDNWADRLNRANEELAGT